MEAFWKAAAAAILTVIFSAAIGKSEKDISAGLSVVACCIVLLVAMQYLSDVTVFLWQLCSDWDYGNSFLRTLLKITGVALVTELSNLISADAGSSSIGKAMQILGNTVILFLSLPLFEGFLSIIQEIMGIL